jgi:hypothetical protein
MKKNFAPVALRGVFSGSPGPGYPPQNATSAGKDKEESQAELKKKGETLRTNPELYERIRMRGSKCWERRDGASPPPPPPGAAAPGPQNHEDTTPHF